MVYALQNVEISESESGISVLLDPGLLKSARQIYHTYFQLHHKLNKHPIGVAIDRQTHRGQLLFCKRPILLPWENFIPIDKLESDIH